MRETSKDGGPPVGRVVRNPNAKSKPAFSRPIKKEPTDPSQSLPPFKSVHEFKSVQPLKRVRPSKRVQPPKRVQPFKSVQPLPRVQPLKRVQPFKKGDPVESYNKYAGRKETISSVISDFSDPLENAQHKAFGDAIEKLTKICREDDFVVPKGRQFRPPPVDLDNIRCSLLRRVLRPDVVLSPAAYDPFSITDPRKVANLSAFLGQEL